MQKKVIDKREFQKAVKISLSVSILTLIFFTITSIVTDNWLFLLTASWCVVLTSSATLAPLYRAYKRNKKEKHC